MDITQQFKASVMTVKLQRKAEFAAKTPDKQRTLPKAGAALTARDEFARQAKDVCNKITTLRNVLLENRTAYMRIGQHLKSAATMTDEQRDLIDRESEKFVTYYTQFLAQMRTDWKRVKRKAQERAHVEAVLDLLVNYLHSVQQIYLDQKKYRVQHELETYRLLKLAGDKKKIPVRPAGENSGKLRRRKSNDGSIDGDDDADVDHANGGDQAGAVDDWNDSWEWGDEDDDEDADTGSEDELLARQQQTLHTSKTRPKKPPNGHASRQQCKGNARRATLAKQSSQVALDEDLEKSAQELDDEDEVVGLNPEDVQMFEQENMQLYHEYQGLSEEVEQIEKNVVDIAQLQDIFTEKVHMQQHNIERIVNAVVGATENVKDANEQIRQATQRNAGIRVWSLFFLLVMSFSLLFLDWYYD